MEYLAIAYNLIAAVLAGYGLLLRRRLQAAVAERRLLEAESERETASR